MYERDRPCSERRSLFITHPVHDLGFEGLSFTLHGLADSHDRYVNRPGAFHDIIQATRQGVEAGFSIHWNLFLDRRNLGEVSELAHRASEEYGGTLYLDLPLAPGSSPYVVV